jgi:macrolide transport system ATP-binding/permease protein
MLFGDIRYAIRVLLRTPGFAIIAVLSLALGIGANTAMFSLADALLLRPLPVPAPTNVVTISEAAPDIPIGTLGRVSYPDYVDLVNKSKTVEGLTAFAYTPVGLAEKADALPQLKLALTVSGNFFQAMGVQPALGRGFSAEEDRVPGRDAVVVLAHHTWQQNFGSDPKIVGRPLLLNNVEFTVVGVAPKKFTGMEPLVHPDLYLPVMMLPRVGNSDSSNVLEDRGSRAFTVKGRLSKGSSVAQANAEMATIASNLAAAYPKTDANRNLTVHTEIQTRVAQSPPNAVFAAMLLAIAGLVLIIACANVANLLLGRSRSRTREMAVRLAIGASRWRLVRQLLTESLLLALSGAALGLLLAQYGAEYFSSFRFANDLPVSLNVQVDQRVLIFSLIAAVISAIFFGLVPALQSSRTDLVPGLKSSLAEGRRGRTLGRNALVISQVALSLVLLSAATLFVRTLRHVIMGNPGFRTDHLLMMSFDPSLIRYSPDKTREFYRTLVEGARQVAHVKNATLSQTVPFDGSNIAVSNIAPEGYQLPAGKESDQILSNVVDEQYFDTIGMPVVRGRAFLAADTATSPQVAVINETAAERYWPNQNPVGKRFRLDGRDGPWVQVVGVAKTSVYLTTGEPRMPFLYLPLAQHQTFRMTLTLETPGDAASLTAPLRNLVRSIDAHQPIYNVRAMREYYRTQGLQALRLIVNVVGTMGILGLGMALVGLYGLVSYSVSRRTREIGIRMAIGANRRDILGAVMRQGFTLALIGVGIGLAGSFGVVRAIRALFSRLQETGMFDPWTFLAVPLALLAVTLMASYIPARRAASIDPNNALHYE